MKLGFLSRIMQNVQLYSFSHAVTCCQLNVYDANNYCFKQMTKKSLAEVGPDSKHFSPDFGTCNITLL